MRRKLTYKKCLTPRMPGILVQVALFLTCSIGLSEQVNVSLLKDRFSNPMRFEELVVKASLLTGNPVNLFTVPLGANAELPSISTVFRLYENKDPGTLTVLEKHLLEAANQIHEGGAAPDSVVNLNHRLLKIDLDKPELNFDQLLTKLVALDERYEIIKEVGGANIILPKNIEKIIVPRFEIRSATPEKAYKALLEEVLNPNDIVLFTYGELPQLQDPITKVSLNLENEYLEVVLTRFTQALGPDVFWLLSGSTPRRLTFYKIDLTHVPSS